MLKRDLRLFLRCLIPAAVLAAVLAAVCAAAAVAVAQGAEKVYTPVKAAVVDGEDSVLSRMLISAVAEVDYIRQMLEVEVCNAAEAYAGLDSGEYAAVIELPKDFLGDILSGAENRGRITLSSAAAVNSEAVTSVAAFGELLLAAGQYAAFSSDVVIDRYIADAAAAGEMLADVNRALLAEAMNAQNKYFAVTVAAYADTGVSLPGHYLMTWLAALVMLCAVMFERLFAADCTRSMLLRLHAAGITDRAFLCWKLLLVFAFLLALLLGGIGVAAQWLPVRWSAGTVLCSCTAAAVVTAAAGAALLAVRKGSSAWMMGALVQLFLCGGLVPRQMLEKPILLAGDLTPLGAARGLLAPMFGGVFSPFAALNAAVWIIGSVTIMMMRLRRLRWKGGAE